MNLVVLCGNLTRDPELTETSGGKSVCNFSIAVNDPFNEEGEADFFNCVAWGNTADTIATYFKKGRKILISGKIKIDKYEKDGVKQQRPKIIVNSFEFVQKRQDDEDDYYNSSSNNRNNNSKGKSSGQRKKPDPESFDDDDIPF